MAKKLTNGQEIQILNSKLRLTKTLLWTAIGHIILIYLILFVAVRGSISNIYDNLESHKTAILKIIDIEKQINSNLNTAYIDMDDMRNAIVGISYVIAGNATMNMTCSIHEPETDTSQTIQKVLASA